MEWKIFGFPFVVLSRNATEAAAAERSNESRYISPSHLLLTYCKMCHDKVELNLRETAQDLFQTKKECYAGIAAFA